ENPELILRRQLDRIKDRAMAEMKAEHLEYEQRMAELEKLEYPKPLGDFIQGTFNAFADRHPWVGEEDIRPKSIAREMFENFRSFAEYILEYELQRSEGLLLRHLNSVFKVLSQTVPDGVKTDMVLEMELYLHTLLRQVDSSLVEEWQRMQDPNYRPVEAAAKEGMDLQPPGAEEADITRDTRSFTAAIRTCIFGFLRAWSTGETEAAVAALDSSNKGDGEPWKPEQLKETLEAYKVEHEYLRLDPEARNLRHTYVRSSEATWCVQQMLVDPEMYNDWVAEFEVDLAASRESGEPVIRLRKLGSLV
ncbi:MAG: DUF3516 domain-containing protein, partial [Acidobacteria bacterium]